ncbi:hypothetical protein WMY93_025320 [Mugilogobius chulae]|uniref:SH2 domain-containing protein n=1 Tax=Mugilogobius chulae TaxID=88201 RepID=A0AAW0NCM2_9GOBI
MGARPNRFSQLVSECQLDTVIRNGVVPEWFHGIISRKESEELLMCKSPGHFLIRVSESRIGYTLSYRAEDRCRHFMIDVVKEGYIILGDNKHHRLLEDLVDFHSKFPIKPFSDLLTTPCGQISGAKTDYEELLFTQRHQNMSDPVPVENIPPDLPFRQCNLMDSAAQPSNVQPSKLYPSLDSFHDALPCLDLTPTTPSPQTSQPPELPSRNVNQAISKKNQPCNKTKCEPPSLPKDHRDHSDSLTSVVSNLKKFKKKFQRKNSSSEPAVYEEVQVNDEVKQEGNAYDVIAEHRVVPEEPCTYSCVGPALPQEPLPQEYQPPPPFAPGYK